MNDTQDPQPAQKAPRPVRKAAMRKASPTAIATVVAEKATPAPAAAKKRRAPSAAAAKPDAKPQKPAKRKPASTEPKPPKVKLVRDSFTIPADEYEVLGALKQRASKAGHPAKKSELLRGGIRLLAALTDEALLAALASVPAIKTGRPKGAKKAD